MNNNRRKQLATISDKLGMLMNDLDMLKEEEQESFDNLPESFQEGERGERQQEAIDNLENAYSLLEEAIERIDLAKE